jgi:hypothetical protein
MYDFVLNTKQKKKTIESGAFHDFVLIALEGQNVSSRG